MSDDLFEEFEFKPLTEGLGFHKKAEQIKTGIQDTRLGDSLSGRLIPDRPMMQDLSKPIATPAADSMSKLMATLPPMNSMKLDFIEERPTAISRTTKQLATELSQPTPAKNPSGFRQTEFQARLEESFAKAFPQPGVRKARATTQASATSRATAKATEAENAMLTAIPAAISSAVVDACTVIGVSILCLVIILTITKANLFGLLNNVQTDKITQLHLSILFLSTLQLYMLVARSFFGMTLGEWAFDAQLGTKREQASPLYPVKVVWRTFLATATLFVLPIISLIARQDLLSPLTGLQLFGRADHDQENL